VFRKLISNEHFPSINSFKYKMLSSNASYLSNYTLCYKTPFSTNEKRIQANHTMKSLYKVIIITVAPA